METDKEIAALNRDKSKAQQKGNLKELANVCNYLGSKLSERGRFQEALQQHKEELSICKKRKDVLGTTIAHRCIGEVYAEMCMYRESIEHLKMYLNLAESEKNMIEVQRAYATIGRTMFMKDDLDKAQTAHESALKLTEK